MDPTVDLEDELLKAFPPSGPDSGVSFALLSLAKGEEKSGVPERESLPGRFGLELVDNLFRPLEIEPLLDRRIPSSSTLGVGLLVELVDARRTLLPRRLRSRSTVRGRG